MLRTGLTTLLLGIVIALPACDGGPSGPAVTAEDVLKAGPPIEIDLSTPEAAIDSMARALMAVDAEALLRVIEATEPEARYVRAIFRMTRLNRAFKARIIEVHGEEGWTEFNDEDGANLSFDVSVDESTWADVQIEATGDTAVARMPGTGEEVRLRNVDGDWRIEAGGLLNVDENLDMDQSSALFENIAGIIAEYLPKIGGSGVTPESLDQEMGQKILSALLAGGAKVTPK